MTKNQKTATAVGGSIVAVMTALFFASTEITFLPGGPMAQRADGLKAMVFTADYGSSLKAYVFRDLTDVRTVKMSETVPAGDQRAQFVEDKLIVAGQNVIKEFTVNETLNWPKSDEFTMQETVANPAICRTADNHIFIVTYEHVVETIFHVVVRRPTVPVVPGAVVPTKWSHQKFEMTPSLPSGIPSKMMTTVQDANGHVNVFATRDSGHSIGRAKFQVANGTATLISWTNMFLSGYGNPGRDGAATPNGEFPFVHAVRDGERIILSYPNLVQEFLCSGIANHVAVVAVYPDDHWELLYDIPLPTLKHVIGSPVFVWPGGVTVMANQINPDCTYSYRVTHQYAGGQAWIESRKLAVDDYATSPAWSSDGYLFRRITDFGYEMTKIELPLVRLTISTAGAEMVGGQPVALELSWPPEAAGYRVQCAANQGGPWSEMGTNNPTIVPPTEARAFFRLIK